MARTPAPAATAPARRMAAPPPPPPQVEEQDSVYNELWATAVGFDPKFAAPAAAESDQDFFKRLSEAIASATENPEVWAALSPEAQQWYDSTVDALTPGQETELDGPDGYYAADEAKPEPEPEPEPAPAARRSGREALMELNAKRKADREAKLNAAGPAAEVAATAPAAARRRGAAAAPAAPAAAPAAPARRAAAAPVAAPAAAPGRRAAAPATPAAATPGRRASAATPRKAAAPTGPSNMEIIRQWIVDDPAITVEQIVAECKANNMVTDNFTASKSTINNILTSTRAVITTIRNLGHWKD